jgi:hypothetical protein
MTDNPTKLVSSGPTTASPLASGADGPDKGPWYRRRGVLLGAGVAAVVAITVLTDLPQPSSRASEIANAKTVIQEINADLAPCAFAAKEAFIIYDAETKNALSPADRGRIPTLLGDDQVACSFTDDSIFQLSSIEVPGSTGGKQLGDVVNSLTLWATSDALGAIEAIQTLSGAPTNAKALAGLARDKQLLASDRAGAMASWRGAGALLRTQLPQLAVPQVPAASSAP